MSQPMDASVPSSEKGTNVFSILAIVFGGVSLLFLPIVFGPAAVILAAVAFSKKEKLAGVGLAVAIVGTLIGFLIGWIVAEAMLAGF
jgi:fucose permease